MGQIGVSNLDKLSGNNHKSSESGNSNSPDVKVSGGKLQKMDP